MGRDPLYGLRLRRAQRGGPLRRRQPFRPSMRLDAGKDRWPLRRLGRRLRAGLPFHFGRAGLRRQRFVTRPGRRHSERSLGPARRGARAGAPGDVGLDLANCLFERKPLARDVRLAEWRRDRP